MTLNGKRQKAEHGIIDPSVKLENYICDESQTEWAKKCSKFLNKLELRAYCYQYPASHQYTCWYIGVREQKKQKPYILHININKTNLTVWFRRPEYLSEQGQRLTKPDQNYRYFTLKDLSDINGHVVKDYVIKAKNATYNRTIRLDKPDKHKKCEVTL
jgi:hypothetical protein